MRGTLGLALVVLIASLGPAMADHSGDDAPNAPEDAAVLAPGVHEGTLGPDDLSDWYAVSFPPTKILRATVRTATDQAVGLILFQDGVGTMGTELFAQPDGSFLGVLQDSHPSGVLKVAVFSRERPGIAAQYVLSIEILDASDLKIPDLRVEKVPRFRTDNADVFLNDRDLVFTVENTGDQGAFVQIAVFERTATDERIDQVDLFVVGEIAPHAVATGRHRWSPLGPVGDVEVILRAVDLTGREIDLADNEASAADFVIVGGTGVGATAPIRNGCTTAASIFNGPNSVTCVVRDNAGVASYGTTHLPGIVGLFYSVDTHSGFVEACPYVLGQPTCLSELPLPRG